VGVYEIAYEFRNYGGMHMDIILLNEFKVIGFKVTCSEERLGTEMPELWKSFMARAGEIKNRSDNYIMDICIEVVGKDYTQCICLKVDDFDFVPSGMDAIVIPSQKYIHHRHEGNVKDIWLSFWNMQKWAKENGYTIDPQDCKIDAGLEDNESIHELYIKIL
jgi:predicted transcriptional regulator YdeE